LISIRRSGESWIIRLMAIRDLNQQWLRMGRATVVASAPATEQESVKAMVRDLVRADTGT
jgi:hypothetical protein